MRILVLVAAFAACLFGQQYPFVDVTGDSRAASVMLLDYRGALWVNVTGGLRCFDGRHWFSLEPLGFPKGASGLLAEDSEGGIWIAAAEAGLYRFHQGQLTRMQSGYARNVIAVRPGLVLVFGGSAAPRALRHYLFRFAEDHGRWTGVQLADWRARSSDYPHVDRKGTVTYACMGAWCELPAQTIADWHPGSQDGPIRHPDVYTGLEAVLRDRYGCLWFRSASLTTSYQCPGDASPKELPFDTAAGELDMNEGSDGSVWLPSGSRLAIGRPGFWRIIRAANGLPDAEHTVVGPDGTVWLVGSTGLFRWPYPFRAEYWTARDGVDMALSLVRAGEQMAAVAGAGIAILNPQRDRWMPIASGKGLGGVRVLYPGPGGSFYASLSGSVYNDRSAGTLLQFSLSGRVLGRSVAKLDPLVYKVIRTSDGPVWFSDKNVKRPVRKGGELVFESAPLASQAQQKMAACWAGGITILEDSRIHRIPAAAGLLDMGCRSIKMLSNGDIWLAYDPAQAFALIRRDGAGHATVRQYYSGADVGDAYTYNFDTDSRGWLWRGGNNAMYISDPKSAEDGKWIELNGVDGFRSSIVAARSSWSDPDGSVWWGTMDSAIFHFTPGEDFVRPAKPPNVFLSGYSWDGGPPQLSQTVRMIPHGANLTALIGSLQFDRRNALRFRYRLDETGWQETRGVDIALGQLHWGNHRLEMQARLLNGSWSALQSETFEIAQPFWVGWRFILS